VATQSTGRSTLGCENGSGLAAPDKWPNYKGCPPRLGTAAFGDVQGVTDPSGGKRAVHAAIESGFNASVFSYLSS